jgi:hypothetical protein
VACPHPQRCAAAQAPQPLIRHLPAPSRPPPPPPKAAYSLILARTDWRRAAEACQGMLLEAASQVPPAGRHRLRTYIIHIFIHMC